VTLVLTGSEAASPKPQAKAASVGVHRLVLPIIPMIPPRCER